MVDYMNLTAGEQQVMDDKNKEINDLQDTVAELEVKCSTADRLAYECAIAVLNRWIRARTRLADTLEDYLEIGGIDGPKTVPEWVQQFEAAEAAREKGS